MKRKTPKRRAASPKRTSPSTAIARREDVKIEVADPDGLLAPVSQQLGELAHTGGIGIRPVKLTKAEEKICARAAKRDEIKVHPKGFIYLPHPVYTRWLSEAFGRGGWSVVPCGKPQKIENLIIVPHLLYVKGVPVAWAYGGAEYYANNKQQTYDDVLESTTAYALRRLAKRFGMALELWDKSYIRAFLAERAVRVPVKDKGDQWRLKDDEPLLGELKPARGKAAAPSEERPAGNDGSGDEEITDEQRRRLVSTWRKAGRSDPDVLLYLKKKYKVSGTDKIKRKDYNAIERALLAKGELALPGDGE